MNLNLIPRMTLGEVDLTDYPFMVEFGSDFGMAENLVQIVQSALPDGELRKVTGKTNRTFSIPLLVEASDLGASALAEQLLAVECSKERNEFRVDPGDGFAPVTVYATYEADWGFQRDDELEQQGFRRFRLTFDAHPFGFSEDEVVDVAVPFVVPTTPTVISDGTSTTGWSTAAPAAVSTSGGKLRVSFYQSFSSPAGFGYTRSGYEFTASKVLSPAVDFTATEYITADVLTEYASPQFLAKVDGVPLQQVSSVLLSQAVNGYTYRVTWRCRDASASLLTINAVAYTLLLDGQPPAGTPTLVIDNVQRSNRVPVPDDSTGRQALRSIPVTGSARTTGSVIVEHETGGLGEVLVYTSSELGVGYDPSMDRWFDPASAGSIPDADTVTGRSVSYGVTLSPDGADYNVPANMLPRGPHLLMLQAQSTIGGPLTWTVSTVVGGVVMASQTGTVQVPAGEDFAILPVGVATLPTVDVPLEGTADVRITLASDQNIQGGGLWSYFIGDGADLTFVRAGAGTPSLGTVHNRLYLEAAALRNDGRPGLFLGTDATGADAFHPGYPWVQSWGRHPMAPPMTLVHTVTTGVANAQVTLRHRPAWFTHAGQ